MGIFTRRPREGHVAPNNGNVTNDKVGRRGRKEPMIMDYGVKPSFGQWLKVTWLDLVTMVIMGVIGLGVS